MIARYDIVQGSEEWHKIKWGKIGGTRAIGLFVKSDTLTIEILSEVTEEYEVSDDYQSKAMQRGEELEPEALYELMQYTGVKIKSVGWLQSKEYPLLGISPDGISECETIQFEVKCLERIKHVRVCIKDKIPSDHIDQCVHAFTVNPKLETLYFACYRPEAMKKLKVFRLTRSSKIDLGLKKKIKVKEDRGKGLKEYVETIPDLKTIDEWVKIAHSEAEKISKEIDNLVELLSF